MHEQPCKVSLMVSNLCVRYLVVLWVFYVFSWRMAHAVSRVDRITVNAADW